MSTSFVLIAVVVSAIAIAVVLAPLRGKQRQAAPGRKHREPVSDYQDTLMALRDLDFDHELGVVAGKQIVGTKYGTVNITCVSDGVPDLDVAPVS